MSTDLPPRSTLRHPEAKPGASYEGIPLRHATLMQRPELPPPAQPTESVIVAKILLALGRDPRCKVWRNNSGALQNPSGRMVRFGLKGSADIMGILRPHGRMLGIECKTATGQLSADQKAFRAMLLDCGGIYILARSVEDALEGMNKAAVLQSGEYEPQAVRK